VELSLTIRRGGGVRRKGIAYNWLGFYFYYYNYNYNNRYFLGRIQLREFYSSRYYCYSWYSKYFFNEQSDSTMSSTHKKSGGKKGNGYKGKSYGDHQYWDDRYTKDPEIFDWYQRYSGLKGIMNENIPKKTEPVLMVGCGNSRLSEEMINDGYPKNFINIDISSVVIELMQKRSPNLIWQVMDVTKMSYENEYFGAVIDKGTLDAILCGEGSAQTSEKMLTEIARVLKPDGIFVCITYGQPSNRLHYLKKKKYNWSVNYNTVAKPTSSKAVDELEEDDLHYVYIMKKGVNNNND